MLKGFKPLGQAVKHFWIDEHGYWALTEQGLRLDIVRARNLQPPIRDENLYHAYMLVETDRSFFLLSQVSADGVLGPWVVEAELSPVRPLEFFFDFIRCFLENPKSDPVKEAMPQLDPFKHEF